MPHKKRCTGRSNKILFSTYLDEKGKACKTLHISCIQTPIKLFPKGLVNVSYVVFSVLVPRGADTLYVTKRLSQHLSVRTYLYALYASLAYNVLRTGKECEEFELSWPN